MNTEQTESLIQQEFQNLSPATPEVAIAMLRNLSGDPEEDHLDADRALLRALLGLGQDEIVLTWLRAKKRSTFWYA